jgi:large subunit ribosomal protein L5
MSFFYYYYYNILKREFLTKYIYKNVYQLPKINKIVLCLNFSQTSLKGLLPLLSALTLVSFQKPYLVTSNRPIILLRVKSGLPVGCKVDLRGQQLFFFFEKLIFSILPLLKDFSL